MEKKKDSDSDVDAFNMMNESEGFAEAMKDDAK